MRKAKKNMINKMQLQKKKDKNRDKMEAYNELSHLELPKSLKIQKKIYVKVDTGLDDRNRFEYPMASSRKP